jgi:hypothetical protein
MFHCAVVGFSILEILFLLLLVYTYKLTQQPHIIIPLFIPMLEFLFIPIFTTKRFPHVHYLMAAIGFSLTFIFSLNFAFYQFLFSPVVAILNGSLTLVVLFLFLWQFLKTRTVYALWEYIYFFAVFVWNMFNALPITAGLKV